jgi:hypothetical protein
MIKEIFTGYVFRSIERNKSCFCDGDVKVPDDLLGVVSNFDSFINPFLKGICCFGVNDIDEELTWQPVYVSFFWEVFENMFVALCKLQHLLNSECPVIRNMGDLDLVVWDSLPI